MGVLTDGVGFNAAGQTGEKDEYDEKAALLGETRVSYVLVADPSYIGSLSFNWVYNIRDGESLFSLHQGSDYRSASQVLTYGQAYITANRNANSVHQSLSHSSLTT